MMEYTKEIENLLEQHLGKDYSWHLKLDLQNLLRKAMHEDFCKGIDAASDIYEFTRPIRKIIKSI